MNKSKQRAEAAEHALLELIKAIHPDGPTVAAMVHTKAAWVGSKDPKAPNASTESDMRRNRRVVFKWARCLLPEPLPPKPMPPLPAPPGPDPDDNPNVVFAGQRFKTKMLSGQTIGEIGGVTRVHLVIWDLANKRAQEYDYGAIITTVGLPVSTSGESDWSDEFKTRQFIQVDQFASSGSHVAGGTGPVGFFKLTLTNNRLLDGLPFEFSLPSGFTKGGGLEQGKGQLARHGTVKVFKGGQYQQPLPPLK